jgi:predicted nicotinamide N-methyase
MRFPLQLQTFVLEGSETKLFIPDENAVREAYQKGEIHFPYWSQVWPAAKALAQFLVRRPEYTAGKNVLEIGAGLGLPSIVAARNASFVLCTDYASEAVAVAGQSANHHRLQNFRAAVLDWNYLPADLEADVVLLSDINYEPAALATLRALIHRFASRKATIILSTPQRLMAKEFVSSLFKLCISQEQITVDHAGQQIPVSTLVMKE